MLTVFGALAEQERENILERQRKEIPIAKNACRRWKAGEITVNAAMQEVGLKPDTFYAGHFFLV